MKRKIYVEDYGYKKLQIYDIEGTNNLILIKFVHENDIYTGIATSNGMVVVPFSNDNIYEIFATADKKEWCFTFKNNNNFRSYHIGINNDKYYLKADIFGNDITSCRLVNTINDDYWFIETRTNDLIEVNLYDPHKAKILTPSFTEISFEEEQGRVLAFVEKDIYKQEDDTLYYLGSMLSFVDKDGNFITPIYVPELDNLYDARCYNNDSNFKVFQTFLQRITVQLNEISENKDNYTTDILENMYSNLYDEKDLIISKGPAKIIKFTGGSNETK